MSTKQQTDSKSATAFNFDPKSMDAYQGNLSTVMPWLRANVTNPFGSQAFGQESTINQDNARALGRRGMSNVTQNAAGLGYSTRGGMFNSMLARAGRDTSNLQSQGFRSSVLNAINRQMGSAGMLSSFQPLMTGSNSNSQQTQTTSGLGTWLPQLAGAGLGAAMGAFTGGASLVASGAKGLAGGGSMGGMGYNGVVGAFPGMGANSFNPLGSGGQNWFPPSSAVPSFYGGGYGYKGT